MGMLVVSLRECKTWILVSLSVQNETPIFLVVKVYFRVASEEVKKILSFCFGGSQLETKEITVAGLKKNPIWSSRASRFPCWGSNVFCLLACSLG